ncbi:pleiotropic regulatory protein RsmS [Aeromonas sp. s8]|uniref:pleiotropic regulatory protein RsmS n=1 Tax=Aeromonas sp. s8 TaxID=3138489 RepID=UPI0034A29363
MSLETAPPEVKLAVDLIELLETNELAPELVLAALTIVKNDYERKLIQESDRHNTLSDTKG